MAESLLRRSDYPTTTAWIQAIAESRALAAVDDDVVALDTDDGAVYGTLVDADVAHVTFEPTDGPDRAYRWATISEILSIAAELWDLDAGMVVIELPQDHERPAHHPLVLTYDGD